MKRSELHRRILFAERYGADNPRGLVRQVVARVVAGYALLLTGILLPFSVGIVLCGLGFAWGPAVALFSLPSGVWLILTAIIEGYSLIRIEIEAPDGCKLDRREHPELDAILERFEDDFLVPRLDRVIVTPGFEASVVQTSALGIFGKPRNHLSLGILLLARLTKHQTESVIAHEFAHLSGRHGRVGNFVYRVRCSWKELWESYADPAKANNFRWGRGFLRRAVSWYWPRLDAWTFVLSRRQELQADAMAADAVGADEFAQALSQVSVWSRTASAWWEEVWRKAALQADPPTGVVSGMVRRIESAPAESAEQRARALRRITTDTDTHPSLKHRLEALGLGEADAWSGTGEVAHGLDLLGKDKLEGILTSLDDAWRRQNLASWKHVHASRRTATNTTEPTTKTDIAWEGAREVLERDGDQAAKPLLEALLDRQPGHLLASLALGRIRVDELDARAVPLLQDAADRAILRSDRDHALHLLLQFNIETGSVEGAEKVIEAMDGAPTRTVFASGQPDAWGRLGLSPHGLASEAVEQVRAELVRHPEVSTAHLARCNDAEGWHYLLSLGTTGRRWPFSDKAKERSLHRDIHQKLQLPGRLRIVSSGDSRLTKAMRNTTAEIYRVD